MLNCSRRASLLSGRVNRERLNDGEALAARTDPRGAFRPDRADRDQPLFQHGAEPAACADLQVHGRGLPPGLPAEVEGVDADVIRIGDPNPLVSSLPGDHSYRFVLHDRDSIFSQELDKAVTQLRVRVLRTPVRAPMANAFCEHLGGSLRRECLDFLISLNERYLRMIVKEWGIHYNRGRPHSSLGPGIPEPSQELVPASDHRHNCPPDTASGRPRSLAAYITSITGPRRLLKRRCRGSNGIFAEPQDFATARVARLTLSFVQPRVSDSEDARIEVGRRRFSSNPRGKSAAPAGREAVVPILSSLRNPILWRKLLQAAASRLPTDTGPLPISAQRRESCRGMPRGHGSA